MLKLSLDSKVLLHDLNPLNAASGAISTVYDDKNFLENSSYSAFESGRKILENAGDSAIIKPNFFVKFLFVESNLYFDLELTQPAYVRTINGAPTNIPQSVTTHTSLVRFIKLFGVFEEIKLTTLSPDNNIKYLLIGSDTADLTI